MVNSRLINLDRADDTGDPHTGPLKWTHYASFFGDAEFGTANAKDYGMIVGTGQDTATTFAWRSLLLALKRHGSAHARSSPRLGGDHPDCGAVVSLLPAERAVRRACAVIKGEYCRGNARGAKAAAAGEGPSISCRIKLTLA